MHVMQVSHGINPSIVRNLFPAAPGRPEVFLKYITTATSHKDQHNLDREPYCYPFSTTVVPGQSNFGNVRCQKILPHDFAAWLVRCAPDVDNYQALLSAANSLLQSSMEYFEQVNFLAVYKQVKLAWCINK